jgi:tryptophanyl-tRNA synthetase
MEWGYINLTDAPESLQRKIKEEIEEYDNTEIICIYRNRPKEDTNVYHVYLRYFTYFTVLRLKVEDQKEGDIEVVRFDIGDINHILRHRPEIKTWLI